MLNHWGLPGRFFNQVAAQGSNAASTDQCRMAAEPQLAAVPAVCRKKGYHKQHSLGRLLGNSTRNRGFYWKQRQSFKIVWPSSCSLKPINGLLQTSQNSTDNQGLFPSATSTALESNSIRPTWPMLFRSRWLAWDWRNLNPWKGSSTNAGWSEMPKVCCAQNLRTQNLRHLRPQASLDIPLKTYWLLEQTTMQVSLFEIYPS